MKNTNIQHTLPLGDIFTLPINTTHWLLVSHDMSNLEGLLRNMQLSSDDGEQVGM